MDLGWGIDWLVSQSVRQSVRESMRPAGTNPIPSPPPKPPTNQPSPPKHKQLRRMAVFRPDDINDLYPFPRNRISYPGVERIKGYRYPAPG